MGDKIRGFAEQVLSVATIEWRSMSDMLPALGKEDGDKLEQELNALGCVVRRYIEGLKGWHVRVYPNMKNFKEYILRKALAKSHLEFCGLSDRHNTFWAKLNSMSSRRTVGRNKAGGKVIDNDSQAVLTDDEWRRLEKEFKEL